MTVIHGDNCPYRLCKTYIASVEFVRAVYSSVPNFRGRGRIKCTGGGGELSRFLKMGGGYI